MIDVTLFPKTDKTLAHWQEKHAELSKMTREELGHEEGISAGCELATIAGWQKNDAEYYRDARWLYAELHDLPSPVEAESSGGQA